MSLPNTFSHDPLEIQRENERLKKLIDIEKEKMYKYDEMGGKELERLESVKSRLLQAVTNDWTRNGCSIQEDMRKIASSMCGSWQMKYRTDDSYYKEMNHFYTKKTLTFGSEIRLSVSSNLYIRLMINDKKRESMLAEPVHVDGRGLVMFISEGKLKTAFADGAMEEIFVRDDFMFVVNRHRDAECIQIYVRVEEGMRYGPVIAMEHYRTYDKLAANVPYLIKSLISTNILDLILGDWTPLVSKLSDRMSFRRDGNQLHRSMPSFTVTEDITQLIVVNNILTTKNVIQGRLFSVSEWRVENGMLTKTLISRTGKLFGIVCYRRT